MHKIKVGDIVGRKSYGKDIIFRVIQIDPFKDEAILKGVDWRLIADSPLDDLEVITKDEIEEMKSRDKEWQEEWFRLVSERRKKLKDKWVSDEQNSHLFFEFPGRVFHMDGDLRYLKLCIEYYEKLGIPAAGVYMSEKEMPDRVLSLLERYKPDILVITGHDSFRSNEKDWGNISNYRNSAYFIETVKRVRAEYERHRDHLVIFAGACQSFFEGLLASGANFASAPARVNIHALDPVYIVEQVAYTSFHETIPLMDLVGNTITGRSGIGGVETTGTYRLGFPAELQSN